MNMKLGTRQLKSALKKSDNTMRLNIQIITMKRVTLVISFMD